MHMNCALLDYALVHNKMSLPASFVRPT